MESLSGILNWRKVLGLTVSENWIEDFKEVFFNRRKDFWELLKWNSELEKRF